MTHVAATTPRTDRHSLRRSRRRAGSRFAHTRFPAAHADASTLANTDLQSQLTTLSRSYDRERTTRAYSAVDQALAALERNASPKVVVDWLVLQI